MNKPIDAFLTRRGLLGRMATLAVSVAGAGVFTRLEPAHAAKWNGSMQLLVNFEINAVEGAGRYHRPYVAVWIEDANGKPVRTLSLWVQTVKRGPKWIPDLRQWYRDEQARKAKAGGDLIATISEPTRAPGRYALAWDGRDDAGKLVSQGDFTVNIEAAREHGTYQIIRSDMTLGTKPFARDLDGNVEIKGARLEYRKR